MRSIQTGVTVPLSSVKPLDRLMEYRAYCLEQTRKALQGSSRRRTHSPVSGAALEPFGLVEGLEYLRCPETGSWFLANLPDSHQWVRLLSELNRFRQDPASFHSRMAESRASNVYVPKMEWIQEALRLQDLRRPRILEMASAPSAFSALLKESGLFSEVLTEEEVAWVSGSQGTRSGEVECALLMEALDRSTDPESLLKEIHRQLSPEGLLFVTALVSSGFDMAVLELRNLYLFPPDRTNCFSLKGLTQLLERHGFQPLEVSTPGVLDLEIVRSHLTREPGLKLSSFERQLAQGDEQVQQAFQSFLQEQGLSSFARIVARKEK